MPYRIRKAVHAAPHGFGLSSQTRTPEGTGIIVISHEIDASERPCADDISL
jgi:hypothetical protein